MNFQKFSASNFRTHNPTVLHLRFVANGDGVNVIDQHVTSDVWWYYMLELAFYCSLVLSLFMDVKRKVCAVLIS